MYSAPDEAEGTLSIRVRRCEETNGTLSGAAPDAVVIFHHTEQLMD